MSKTTTIGLIATVLLFVGLYFIFDYRSESADKNPNPNGSAVGEKANKPELKIEVLQEGDGEGAKTGDTVSVHYVGTLVSGQRFDSSRNRGQPFSFQLGAGQVIPGWDQGLQGMKVGEKRRLTIPPELAYGEQGAGNIIGPNATLIFEVEMLSFN